MWLKAYTNDWYQTDDDLSNHRNEQDEGPDSLDENVLTDETYAGISSVSGKVDFSNGFMSSGHLSPFNVYQQIDKLTNSAQLLTKKLETTEL